ncbi:hypothetical protein CROQUDRAFT_48041 [Cronartium quercuum f. sp. fusiforme G11]|uniref:Fe2OG dioxygenase domain-containing protein n=1 Tax=Cronartium quercuum f. sp. fusiforme G11 TaxID=708437 RepID=A0A9P6NGZ7_9BASI|nr:hypothetical protein CROQUDRAFT_48041 [Cronartium quercuum f. sp. fusiforme G11]
MSQDFLDPYRLAVPIPEIFLIPDFITRAEESYLSQKTDQVGNSNMVIEPGNSISIRAGGWQHIKHRRSMYWGGTLTAKGSLIPRDLPGFVNHEWPNVFQRISRLGIFSDSSSKQDPFIEPNHCLVNEYLPGDGILPHQDGPAYFPTVATLSLDAHTTYDFYSYIDDHSISPSFPETLSTKIPTLVIHPPSQESTSPVNTTSPTATGRPISPDPIFSLFVPRRSLIIIRSRCYTDLLHAIPNRRVDRLNKDLCQTLNWDPNSDLHMILSQSIDPQLERERRISLTCRRVERVIKGLSRFGK